MRLAGPVLRTGYLDGWLVDSTIAAGMPASLTADGCAALNGPYGSRVAASAR